MEIELKNKRYRFYIEEDFLIITKKIWFKYKAYRRIKCSTITKVKYKNPNEGVPFVFQIVGFCLQSIISTSSLFYDGVDNFWKNNLIITYSVNGDKATCIIGVNLNKSDVNKLKKSLRECGCCNN